MLNKTDRTPVVMVIGGMDPTGGAGLCADIQTLSNLGCHAAPITTAVTNQDTTGVKSFELVNAELIKAQMLTVLVDMSPSVVKTGMLGSREIISVIAEVLGNYPGIRLIIDPVMSSNNNDDLSEHSLSDAIIDHLMPIASLISPNLPEAISLAGMDASDIADADTCARRIYEKNSSCDCLITGTHAESRQVINRYFRQGKKLKEWTWERLKFEYHGSGCTLASAIAAGVAQGISIEQAVEQAQHYVMKSLINGFKPGKGQHVPYRLCTKQANLSG